MSGAFRWSGGCAGLIEEGVFLVEAVIQGVYGMLGAADVLLAELQDVKPGYYEIDGDFFPNVFENLEYSKMLYLKINYS